MALSCRNVDDQALSCLQHFPSLRELMAMDIADSGFRHVGRCRQLEALWCMYCRDTGDVATEHVTGLANLKAYYAGRAQITDRSLELLGRMASVERLEFWECTALTEAGLADLSGLPRLRELTIGGIPAIGKDAARLFPKNVRVAIS
jgi:hypothetical protein